MLLLSSAATVISGFAIRGRVVFGVHPGLRTSASVFFGLLLTAHYHTRRSDVYNILWAVVFGFATLNILNLSARRFEPTRRGLSFGELMAVLIVLLSIFLLGWELLNLLHIFPIKLRR